jgi:hypothetical protein
MATKTIILKGGQLMDTDTESVGFVADDESGLHFVAGEDTGESQRAYCTVTHMVNETATPIWNQIIIDNESRNTTESDNFKGVITLEGIKPDGTITPIMEETFTSTSSTGGLRTFELLGSSCTNDAFSISPASSDHGAGTIGVYLPMRYGQYEDIDLMGSWYDDAWGYRKALTIERTNGQMHGAHGHSSDWYGTTVYVPYAANMASTTQADVRFTGPDGVTELPHFQLDVADSTSAVYIVMLPWPFLDQKLENYTYEYTDTMHRNPQFIYCYYGNAAATSASDVTLGGHALFYDDFSSDLGWTFGGAANTTEVIENGYLELRSAASQTSTAYANRDMDFSGSDSTSWEVIFKIIYDTPAYTNTTASNGPYIRIRGRDNTGSGGADETGSYWETKHFYLAAGAGESGANPAGHMWGRAYYDSGVDGGTNYANNIVCGVSDDQYIKFRWNKRDTAGGGTNYMQWFQSDDGVNWNTIGDLDTLTKVFDTVTDLNCALYYVGKSGVAADKYIRFDAIMAYPIMSGTVQHIRWEESFQNGTYSDRYGTLNVSAGVRTLTETQDLLTFGTTAGNSAVWNDATKNGICLTLGGGITGINYNQQDVFVYEGTIASLTEAATANQVQEIGICISDRVGTTSADVGLFGIRWVQATSSRVFWRQTFIAGASDLSNSFGTWAQADFPIGIRMVFDNRERILYYMARKYGSGGEWQVIYRSPTAWERWITGGYGYPMMYYRTGVAGATSAAACNWSWDNGGGIIDSHGKVGATGSAWLGEEALADYPLAFHLTPSAEDRTVYFTVPSPNHSANAMKLRIKEWGGDYNFSKPILVTDNDTISVGPSGTDQYIGMRLRFDFLMDADDEIAFDEIRFIYEVI